MDAAEFDLIADLLNAREEKIWDWEMANYPTCISENGLDFDHDEPCAHEECHEIPEGETEESWPYEGCELTTCDPDACDEFRTELRAIRTIRTELLGWSTR